MRKETPKRSQNVMVRLDTETYDLLVKAAESRNRKVGEYARTLIEDALGVREKELDELFDSILKSPDLRGLIERVVEDKIEEHDHPHLD